MPSDPRLESVAGVIVWTEHLDPMVRFYREVLALPVHSVHDDFVAFELAGMRLSVGAHSRVLGETSEPYRIMLNFAVHDIQASFRSLTENGVEFVRPPEPEHWGGWVATFRDPDGNLLQLLQPAAASG